MPGRTAYKVILLFGMLFSGGLIPTFMIYKSLGLLNKFAVLIVPLAINIFHTIIVLNFFRGISPEMAEAAEVDGASHLDVLFRIYLPLSMPALVTVVSLRRCSIGTPGSTGWSTSRSARDGHCKATFTLW